jgi:hypothetical protein
MMQKKPWQGISIYRTLGLFQGMKAICFSFMGQSRAMIQGHELYEEDGKRKIWFKMYFLKVLYEYLNRTDSINAYALFEKIIEANEVVRDLDMMPVTGLICNCDFQFWKDYHPNVKFSRDKTLFQRYHLYIPIV